MGLSLTWLTFCIIVTLFWGLIWLLLHIVFGKVLYIDNDTIIYYLNDFKYAPEKHRVFVEKGYYLVYPFMVRYEIESK